MKELQHINKIYGDLLPVNKNIDHQRCHPSFPDDSVWEKWWNILGRDAKEKEYQEEKDPYVLGDFEGKGRIKPGDTIQWQHFQVLEVDDKGKWSKIKVTYTTKVYTIKKSVVDDMTDGRIPSRALELVFIKTPEAFDIFELLEETNKGLTVTKIGNITGLSRNTVYRFCKYLVSHDWLKREDDLSYTVLDPDNFGSPVKFYKE